MEPGHCRRGLAADPGRVVGHRPWALGTRPASAPLPGIGMAVPGRVTRSPPFHPSSLRGAVSSQFRPQPSPHTPAPAYPVAPPATGVCPHPHPVQVAPSALGTLPALSLSRASVTSSCCVVCTIVGPSGQSTSVMCSPGPRYVGCLPRARVPHPVSGSCPQLILLFSTSFSLLVPGIEPSPNQGAQEQEWPSEMAVPTPCPCSPVETGEWGGPVGRPSLRGQAATSRHSLKEKAPQPLPLLSTPHQTALPPQPSPAPRSLLLPAHSGHMPWAWWTMWRNGGWVFAGGGSGSLRSGELCLGSHSDLVWGS